MLYLIGEINNTTATEIIKQLDAIKLPTELLISSEGGSVYDALLIYNRIVASPVPITTIGSGLVASAAVLLLAAGSKRIMDKQSWVMLHQGSVKLGRLTPTQLEREIQHARQLEYQYCDILAEHSSTDSETWERFCKNEVYLSPAQVKELGLIDFIKEA